jgi:hypothetical protein
VHGRHDVADSDRVPIDKLRDPEAELGGADAVPKTTYITGEGTEPERRKGALPAARVSGGVPSAVVWVVVALAVLGALAYLVGLGR